MPFYEKLPHFLTTSTAIAISHMYRTTGGREEESLASAPPLEEEAQEGPEATRCLEEGPQGSQGYKVCCWG